MAALKRHVQRAVAPRLVGRPPRGTGCGRRQRRIARAILLVEASSSLTEMWLVGHPAYSSDANGMVESWGFPPIAGMHGIGVAYRRILSWLRPPFRALCRYWGSAYLGTYLLVALPLLQMSPQTWLACLEGRMHALRAVIEE